MSVRVDLRLRSLDDFFRTPAIDPFSEWYAASDSPQEMLAVAAEGLSIAAWVLLWHPLEALVFNRWDHRLDRRVLRTIRDRCTVRVEPLDAERG